MPARMYNLNILIFIALLTLSSCSKDPIIGLEAEAYLNEMMDVMEASSINRNDINWADFRLSVINEGGRAQTIEECGSAIELALTMLGDNHSFIRNAAGDTVYLGDRDIQCSPVVNYNITDIEGVAYIKIDSFSSSDFNEMKTYAESIQSEIRSNDAADLKGWIVDLRGNLGGNMWPMLAGVGPILGDGIAGYFIDSDSTKSSWSYMNGSSLSSSQSIVEVSNSYQLMNPNPKVAVLLDGAVASSGEAIAVSFEGRENTKSFGSGTCGLSTSNTNYTLSDGSALFLTTSYMADRNEQLYGVPVEPDLEVDQLAILDSVRVYFNE